MIAEKFQELLNNFDREPIEEATLNSLKYQVANFIKGYEYYKYDIVEDSIHIYLDGNIFCDEEGLAILKGIGIGGMLEKDKKYKLYKIDHQYMGYIIFRGIDIQDCTINYRYEYMPVVAADAIETRIVLEGGD